MKIELKIENRMILHQLLPGAKGDIKTVRAIRKLKNELMVSKEELDALKFQNFGNGKYAWEAEQDLPIEFEIGDSVLASIKKRIDELDKNGEMQDYHLDLLDLLFPVSPTEDKENKGLHLVKDSE